MPLGSAESAHKPSNSNCFGRDPVKGNNPEIFSGFFRFFGLFFGVKNLTFEGIYDSRTHLSEAMKMINVLL